MRRFALTLAAGMIGVSIAGLAQAQNAPGALPAPSGSTAGQAPNQPQPGQGPNAATGGQGGTGANTSAAAPRTPQSEFTAFKVENGRAPLLAPAGTLAPGQRAPSQPPAVIPTSPWLEDLKHQPNKG